MKRFAMLLIFIPTFLFSQPSKHDSIWLPMKFFLGKWQGTGEGEPGKGKYERSYTFVLSKRFIEVKNKSTYPPTNKNPKGEVHEDVGYMSYDGVRKTFVLRQFHIEGFVNQYKLDSISTDGKTIVFVSEAIENIPPGWQAKETYMLSSENEFTETFELAEPNKGFGLYSKAVLKRKK